MANTNYLTCAILLAIIAGAGYLFYRKQNESAHLKILNTPRDKVTEKALCVGRCTVANANNSLAADACIEKCL